MLNAKKVLELVNNCVAANGISNETFREEIDKVRAGKQTMFELAKIAYMCEQEIKEEAIKSACSTSFAKAQKKLDKMIAKNERESIRKAWIDDIGGEEKVCACVDGYWFACFDKDKCALPIQDEVPLHIAQLIPNGYYEFPIVNYNISDVIAEAKKATKKNRVVVKVGEKYFNAKYLADVLEVLGNKGVKHYQNANGVGIDIFESEYGIAGLCPINPKSLNGNVVKIEVIE